MHHVPKAARQLLSLKPPASPPYDYDALAYYISLWRNSEDGAPWTGRGYDACAPAHRLAVTSRQWDSEGSVLDDELERNTVALLGKCLEDLSAVDRCLVMYGNCGVPSKWVDMMEPQRAQARYEAALLQLALLARREGIDL